MHSYIDLSYFRENFLSISYLDIFIAIGFPFELSNGICSLNPHVDRLVTSCLFSIDEQGHILTTHICKGVINSKHRLTYTYVNEFLNKTRYEKTEYNDLEKMLISLQEVSSIIYLVGTDDNGRDLF